MARRHARSLIEINDGGLNRRRQLCPVFMWCLTLDIGAHHACWLLLQALFMTASVLTATSTTATRTMTKGLFMVTYLCAICADKSLKRAALSRVTENGPWMRRSAAAIKCSSGVRSCSLYNKIIIGRFK